MADIFEDGLIDFSYSTVGGSITANITPFSHNVVTNTSNDGSTIDYTYTFAQAYIVTNSPFDSRASGLISGMNDGFSIPVDTDIEFQVKATLSKQNYKILGAEFFTGLPSEEGQNSGDFTYPIFDYISEDTGGSFRLIYPICSVRNQHVVNQTTRDNIVIDKVQFKQLGGTGASTNGEGGIVHIIQESGRQDPSLPIRFRGISGGSGVQVRYESADPTGDFYHSGDGGLIIIDSPTPAGGGASSANVGDAADVYVEGTSTPFNFRSLTGAHRTESLPPTKVYVTQDTNVIRFSGQAVRLSNTGEISSESVKVYVDSPETGPATESKAAFREIYSEDSSVGIGLTNSNNTISITYDSGKYKSYYNWTGANTGEVSSESVKVYVEGTGPVGSNKAAFREIYSESGTIGIGLTNSDNTISIEFHSGKYKPYYNWTGENVGSQTAIYVDGTGPVASNEAQFRSLKSSDSSVGIGLTDSNNVIDITTDLQKTTDGGQSTTNKVGVGTDGTYVPSNYLEIYGTTKIQNRTTVTDGTLQFGNQAASNITYSHTNSAIEFGENITGLHFINGGTVGIGTSNSIVLGGINKQSL